MAFEIFKLVGSIFVDSDKANESIKKTDKNAEGLGKKFISGVGKAAKWGAGIAAGAAAGAAALGGIAVKAAGVTDNIDKMSQKIGISRTAYQELDFICSQSGASVDNLKAGMKTLTNQMQSAADGSKTASSAFEALGLSWEDGTGKLKSQEDMMWEAFSALQSMDDQTQKAALATDLFGKAGTELMPMLNGASGSIEEMRQQAHDLGLVLSDDSIDAGVNFTDTMDQVKRSLSSIVTKIGVSVMPIFQSALDWVIDNMPMIQSVFEAVFGVIETVVTTVGDIFSDIFENIKSSIDDSGITFQTVFDTISQVFQDTISFLQEQWETNLKPVFQSISDFFSGVMDSVCGTLDSTGITFEDVFNAIKTVIDTAFTFIKDIWFGILLPVFEAVGEMVGIVAGYFIEKMPQIQEFVGNAFNDIKNIWENNLKPCFEAIKDFLNDVLIPAFKFVFENVIAPVVDAVFKTIGDLWENSLKPIFTNIIDFVKNVFSGNFSDAFQNIVNIVGGIWDGLTAVVKTPINAVIGIINKFIGGLNKLEIPDWVPVVGGKGINIQEIPLLAKGGNVIGGGQAIVGEAGAELIDLPAGARVTPLTNGKGDVLGMSETIEVLKMILAELKAMHSELYDIIIDAIVNGVEIEWNNRTIARMVRKYA